MNLESFFAAVDRGRSGLYLNVHVQPGAKRQQLRGLYGNAIKISIQAQAVDGKANQALVAFIAQALSLPRQQVQLASGQASRRKRIYIQGEEKALMQLLSRWLHDV